MKRKPLSLWQLVLTKAGGRSALAQLCGVTRGTAARWGTRGIPWAMHLRISRGLGIPLRRFHIEAISRMDVSEDECE